MSSRASGDASKPQQPVGPSGCPCRTRSRSSASKIQPGGRSSARRPDALARPVWDRFRTCRARGLVFLSVRKNDFGAMAQLVARFHGMEEATGSNPVSSTPNRSDRGNAPELGRFWFLCNMRATSKHRPPVVTGGRLLASADRSRGLVDRLGEGRDLPVPSTAQGCLA